MAKRLRKSPPPELTAEANRAMDIALKDFLFIKKAVAEDQPAVRALEAALNWFHQGHHGYLAVAALDVHRLPPRLAEMIRNDAAQWILGKHPLRTERARKAYVRQNYLYTYVECQKLFWEIGERKGPEPSRDELLAEIAEADELPVVAYHRAKRRNEEFHQLLADDYRYLMAQKAKV